MDETTYSVGATARLTGLTPDVLRAWERRYGVVEPLRTDGGTRRYRESDVERLQLVKAAVDAGERIGSVAALSDDELRDRQATPAPRRTDPLADAIDAIDRLDGVAAERIISSQLAALGPVRFARDFALPLLGEIGEGWESKRLCVASEHLGSSLLRSLLGSALRVSDFHRDGPVVVFGTLPGERHELGLLIAALASLGAGAQPLFLGADLPVEELALAADRSGARAIALSVVTQDPEQVSTSLRALDEELGDDVEVWVGGPSAMPLDWPEGMHTASSLDDLERRVQRLRAR